MRDNHVLPVFFLILKQYSGYLKILYNSETAENRPLRSHPCGMHHLKQYGKNMQASNTNSEK